MTTVEKQLTPRKIDAALAEAIGWHSIVDLQDPLRIRGNELMGMPPHGPLATVPTYYSAPTWKTSGQLIEGMAARGWMILTTGPDEHQEWSATLMPKTVDGAHHACRADCQPSVPQAVAEAARLALGIGAPEE